MSCRENISSVTGHRLTWDSYLAKRESIKDDLSFCCSLVVNDVTRICEGSVHGDNAMKDKLPNVYLARHGETAWSLSGQHTGLTDLTLTERGEQMAQRLQLRLRGFAFEKVFTSPLQRAQKTCELAGFGGVAEIDPDLVEWDYGEYEGRRGVDIRAERPGWNLFKDGCPGGETPAQVTARADRVANRVRVMQNNVLLFTSGHFIRVLAARWLGLEPTANSRYFMLSTASLSALGYEDDLSRPVIRFWNDTCHVGI